MVYQCVYLCSEVALLLEQDELKKNQGKEFNKQYQERIFQENLDNIARKQKLKEMEQARDK